MLKKLYPNTLLKKCIYMICVCTAALFALTSGLIYQQASSFLMLRILGSDRGECGKDQLSAAPEYTVSAEVCDE